MKFYDPKKIFDPLSLFQKDKKKESPVSNAATDKAAEDAAAAAAADNARKVNAARTGSSSTALSPLQPVTGLETKRKTLGSAA